MNVLDVIPTQTKVNIGPDGAKVIGVVAEIAINGRSVRYRVLWWDGRVRRDEWLFSHEVDPCGDCERQKIGFRG